jgi:serine/threonine protein kinase
MAAMTCRTAVERFGAYRLLRRLHLGPRSEVYAASPAEGGEPPVVALKRALPSARGDRDLLHRLRQEHRLLLRLEGAPFCQALELSEHGGLRYLTTTHVPGPSLRRLREHQQGAGVAAPAGWVARVGARVLEGLARLHDLREGYVHRDVSPENVLIGADGEAWLVDLGVAHPIGAAPEEGGHWGKRRYASPEQRAGRALDGRSDLVGLGLTLLELLCARSLSRGEAEMVQHSGGAEVLGVWLSALVSASPDLRPDSAAAAARRLDEIAADLSADAALARAFEAQVLAPARADIDLGDPAEYGDPVYVSAEERGEETTDQINDPSLEISEVLT